MRGGCCCAGPPGTCAFDGPPPVELGPIENSSASTCSTLSFLCPFLLFGVIGPPTFALAFDEEGGNG